MPWRFSDLGLPDLPDWEGEPQNVPAPPWRKRQWELQDQREEYDKYWQTPFHEGDEVVRTYNGEPGHIMAIEPTKGFGGQPRYKVTSPSNPAGFTYEWGNHIQPQQQLPQAPNDLSGLGIPPEGEDYYRNAKSGWRMSGLEDFHQDAAQQLQDYEGLARDIMKTLPEDQWPQWVKNQAQRMVWGPQQPVDMTPYPHKDALDTTPSDLTFPEDWKFE